MNAHLHLALGQDRLQALRDEAKRDRQARAARPTDSERKRQPRLLALLRLKPA